ncbi:MAG: polysaccharide biosynthesis C-terminal domain-containing protein [Schleiferiaceae bacterium]
MSSIKKLFSQTLTYGLSSILGRFAYFLLVPLHTAKLPSREEYGINTDIYTIIAFLMVILIYGMETAFFRYSEKKEYDKGLVYSTILKSIFSTTALFIFTVWIFFEPIIESLRYEANPRIIVWMIAILVMEVTAAIPMAKLRSENRAKRFVGIKLAHIFTNVGLNVVFLWLIPLMAQNQWPGGEYLQSLFPIGFGVEYIFLANVIACIVYNLLLIKEFKPLFGRFDLGLWKKLMIFGWPLMISGLAGVANEVADRQFIKYLLPENISLDQLGVYGAVYKLSIFLILFNQAFRYAAEPFFFSQSDDPNSKDTLARVMKYFVIILGVGFVFVSAFIPIFKQFIAPQYWEGLYVVPILLAANVFLSINTQVSIWYKLMDKTQYGMIITFSGFAVTLGLNLWLVPTLGYEGAAWATLASYFTMTAVSLGMGQNLYPIPYNLKRIVSYLFISFALGYLAYSYTTPYLWFSVLCLALTMGLYAYAEKEELQRIVAALKNRRK